MLVLLPRKRLKYLYLEYYYILWLIALKIVYTFLILYSLKDQNFFKIKLRRFEMFTSFKGPTFLKIRHFAISINESIVQDFLKNIPLPDVSVYLIKVVSRCVFLSDLLILFRLMGKLSESRIGNGRFLTNISFLGWYLYLQSNRLV